MRKPVFFLLLCVVMCAARFAGYCQTLSYVYIQGDKQTPFYVKLEGEMQPRYGKNYSIISSLAPGPIHLEILFQQNIFPPLHFTVVVPDGGNRGFLITKQQDSFVLYDLQQQFYLPNNNTAEEDHVPAHIVSQPVQHTEAPVEKSPEVAIVEKPKPKALTPKPRKKPITKPVAKTQGDTAKGEQFIEGITLNNQHDDPVTKTSAGETNTDTGTSGTTTNDVVQSIPNSDCPTPLSKEDFSGIYKNTLDKSDDEARIAYILTRMDVCYASWQARALATMLTTDAARFTLLKKIYPRISDQGAFALLDDLLRDAAYKESFNQMLHPKL